MQSEIKFASAMDPLTRTERAVWSTLQGHYGRARAIKKVRLAALCDLHERDLRNILKRLIQVHGLPIGSTPSHPQGYFVINSEEELAEIAGRYHRQALSLLYRVMRLKKVSAHQIARQIEMDLNL
ncbi:MAG: hypothetical protein OXI23_20680 [Gemmatimonadota bacterium]|nr:hypothetical protein [Gemmatimonadota bacterium]